MDIRILIPVVVIVGIFVTAMMAFIMRRRTTGHLQQPIGPEYGRAVTPPEKDTLPAEDALSEHGTRVEVFPLRPLSPIDRDAYAMEWASVQRRFIDDPSAAVGTADRLANRVMIDRGYPMTDFEQHAADISVSYPAVVQNYRAGHGIVMRHADGHATTEELRQAMIHYRTLFDELLQASINSAPAKVHPINQKRGEAAQRAS
jgi:hypothetical protein